MEIFTNKIHFTVILRNYCRWIFRFVQKGLLLGRWDCEIFQFVRDDSFILWGLLLHRWEYMSQLNVYVCHIYHTYMPYMSHMSHICTCHMSNMSHISYLSHMSHTYVIYVKHKCYIWCIWLHIYIYGYIYVWHMQHM